MRAGRAFSRAAISRVVTGLRLDGGDRLVGVACWSSPGRPAPRGPGRARPAARRPPLSAASTASSGVPSRSLSSSDDALGALAADARHLGERLEVGGGDGARAARWASGRRAWPAPAWGRRRWPSGAARRRSARRRSAKPKRVSDSSRTTSEVASRASSPTLSVARVAGVQCSERSPTPPTSITAPSGAIAVTCPATDAITSAIVRPCRRPWGRPGLPWPWPRPRPACAGPRRATRGRWPGRARRRRRRAWACASSRSSRVTMAATAVLSARAAAGDGGLDLGRGVQARPAARAGPRRAIAIAPRLGGAHDRADVVLAEDPLDRHRVGAARRRATARCPPRCRPAGRRGRRRRRVLHDADGHQASAARPGRRRRRPGRTGSAPGSMPITRTGLPPRAAEHCSAGLYPG